MSAPPPSISPEARRDDASVLARNPLLAGLAAAEREELVDLLDQVALPAGTEVVRESDEGEHMYFVLQGTASVRRHGLVLNRLQPGDHFGELALVGVRRRAATVTTETVVRLARLSRPEYHALVEEHPRIALRFLQALVGALGDSLVSMTDSVAMLLGDRSAPARAEIDVTIAGDTRSVRAGSEIRGLLPEAIEGRRVVCALLDSRPVSLHTRLLSDATLTPVTIAEWEGREAWRRSGVLLLLEAAARVAPHTRLQAGPSIGAGRVIRILSGEGPEARAALRATLERALHALVGEDVHFRDEVHPVEEAAAELQKQGWQDGAALLLTSRSTTVTLQTCGRVFALGLSPVVPSAGMLTGLQLHAHPDGFLLDFGDAVSEHLLGGVPAAHETLLREQGLPRFGGTMADEHARWLGAAGIRSVGTFNQACVRGEIAGLVRVAEGFHEKHIGAIADRVAARRKDVRVICIAGPSSSGKTTFIKRLSVQLEIDGMKPVTLSTDDYYVDRARTPRDATGDYDFEALEAIDLELLGEHVSRLMAGETVATSRYDFVTGSAHPTGGRTLHLDPGAVLLVEGIHGLNPRLFGGRVPGDRTFKIFLHPATTLPLDGLGFVSAPDLRLLRRIVRDRHTRGYKAADNIQRWPSVRRGEQLHIYPYLGHADEVFDTSLVYEPAVLKVYADRYLLEVPREHPAFPTAYRLRRLVDQFVAVYPDHVPPTSILREFIGGSGFEY